MKLLVYLFLILISVNCFTKEQSELLKESHDPFLAVIETFL